MDWITIVLVSLLLATLLAYFSGIFPYPYGWIILSVILVMRFAANKNNE